MLPLSSQERGLGGEVPPPTDVERLSHMIASHGSLGLVEVLRELPFLARTNFLLLVDQFEEIYSLCPDADERDAFVDNLLCAVSDSAANVSAIITLRTDFLGETQKHPKLNASIADHGTLIPAMKEDELRRAWGTAAQREVRWPLTVHTGRTNP